MQVAGRDGVKLGFSSETVTSTRGNVMIFGGHSGQGMLYAKELANSRTTSSITTVSKSGFPRAPGISSAFLAAMSTECTHYMAACDVTDAKAVECLTDWAPPVSAEEQWPLEWEEQGSGYPMLEQIKQDMGSMGVLQLRNALKMLEDAKLQVIYQRREVKSQLQHKNVEQKERLQEYALELEERETVIVELIAELVTKLGAIAEE